MRELPPITSRILLSRIQYSSKYNYIYVDTPKVSCSTIKLTLQRAERESLGLEERVADTGQYGYSDLLMRIHDRGKSPLLFPNNTGELDRISQANRFTFCFCRNPFTRVLSAYIDKIERNAERRALFELNLMKGAKGPRQVFSFTEFLELIKQQEPEVMDPHWRPQYVHIDTGLRYDACGNFEHFEEDFRKILQSIDSNLVRYAMKVDEHKTHSLEMLGHYYSDSRSIRLAQEIYERDFALFGYAEDISRVTERNVSTTLVRPGVEI